MKGRVRLREAWWRARDRLRRDRRDNREVLGWAVLEMETKRRQSR